MKDAFSLGSHTESPEDIEKAKIIYEAVRNAVFEADSKGRNRFREPGKKGSFKELNELLEANGVDASPVKHFEEKEYSFVEVLMNYHTVANVFYNRN